MGLQSFNELAPVTQAVTLNTASGTGSVNLTPATLPVWRCDQIMVVSNDTASRVMRLIYHDASGSPQLGSASIPAGAGTAGAAPIDLLQAIVPLASRGLVIAAGAQVQVAMESAITAALTITVTALGGTL